MSFDMFRLIWMSISYPINSRGKENYYKYMAKRCLYTDDEVKKPVSPLDMHCTPNLLITAIFFMKAIAMYAVQ